jgi:hypothetical protein
MNTYLMAYQELIYFTGDLKFLLTLRLRLI